MTEPATVAKVLAPAVERLRAEFMDTFDATTIERFLMNSYEQLSDRATTLTFVPLIAERFARQRLQALARNEARGHSGTPIVLFLCTHNAGRSQMALGWFDYLAGDRAIAWSGGSEPGTELNPAAIAAMAEVGIDITAEYPKPWTEEIVRAADVVVTMGCGDTCPYYPGNSVRGLGTRRPRGTRPRSRQTDPRRDRTTGAHPSR